MSAVAAPPLIKLDNLLFATDFSASAEAVLPLVLSLAHHHGATVHFLPLAVPVTDATKRVADEQLRKFAASEGVKLAKHDEIMDGEWSSLVLPALVRQYHVDLIALATWGHDSSGRLLGSIAEDTLLTAECAVLTMASPVSVGPEPQRILLPMDFRSRSMAALSYAIALAHEFDASLTLLHVAPQFDVPIEEPCVGGLMETEPEPPRDPRITSAGLQAQLRALLRDSELPRATCSVQFGVPAPTILRVLREQDIGLVVMGVQRPRAWSSYVRFTTAQQVASSATCPVLTVGVPA